MRVTIRIEDNPDGTVTLDVCEQGRHKGNDLTPAQKIGLILERRAHGLAQFRPPVLTDSEPT